jgi:electron transfer flavoprotein alpha subunit
MKKHLQIWVFGDHRHDPQDRLTLHLLAKARSLAGDEGTVTGILVGHLAEPIAKKYIACGAHRVLLVDHPQLAFYRADLWTTIIGLEYEPESFWFVLPSSVELLRGVKIGVRSSAQVHLFRMGRGTES